jgi:hypothetical protein
MTLQSSFDLDIFVSITTTSSRTIVSARGVEEVFGLLHYSFLALIGLFLSSIRGKVDRVTNWFDVPNEKAEIALFCRVGLFFAFSIVRELWKELIRIAN